MNDSAFIILKKNFLEKTDKESIYNFLFYHCIRNLKITLLKIINRFKQAKLKQLNPLIARQLKSFLESFSNFLTFLKTIELKETDKIEIMSERLEEFRDKAEESSFLCGIEEEFYYDEIGEDEIEKIFKMVQEIDLEEEISLEEESEVKE